MKTKQKILLTLLTTLLIACSTAGTIKNIQNREMVAKINTGTTTQKEIYELFGEPTHRGTKPEGESWWAYYYPGSGEGASLSIDFDKNGKVKSYNYIP